MVLMRMCVQRESQGEAANLDVTDSISEHITIIRLTVLPKFQVNVPAL